MVTKEELKQRAKELEIKNISKLNKPELLKKVKQAEQKQQKNKQKSNEQKIVYTDEFSNLEYKLINNGTSGLQIFIADLDKQTDSVKKYYMGYWKRNGEQKLLNMIANINIWEGNFEIDNNDFLIHVSFTIGNELKIISGNLMERDENVMINNISLFEIIRNCIGVYNW
jgi:hypothetical protein